MSNRDAFLAMLALSEIGGELLDIADTNNGYSVLVGCTPEHLLLFTDYSTHPNILNAALDSTAAGRYQIIHPTFKALCAQHGYTDFSPATQDAMAINLIDGRRALEDVDNGNLVAAIKKVCLEWASLPGGTSGQHEQQIAYLQQCYTDAGGTITG